MTKPTPPKPPTTARATAPASRAPRRGAPARVQAQRLPEAAAPQPQAVPLLPELADAQPYLPADPAWQALGRSVPPSPVGQADQLQRLHPAVQRTMLLQLQRHQGNFHVQRIVQRLKAQRAEAAAGAPAPAAADDALARRIQAAHGGGRALPAAVAETLGEPLGGDLTGVRVHADAEADALARSVDAVAFTTGQDIFFRGGAYEPDTTAGLELLAHELAHTVQQAQGPVEGTEIEGGVAVSDPSDRFERAADQAARAAVRHAATPAQLRPASTSPRHWQAQRSVKVLQREGDPFGHRSAAKPKAEVSFDVKDDSIKIEIKGEVPAKTFHWKWGQLDTYGTIAVSGEALIPGVGKQTEVTGQKNKASINSLTNRVSEASIREGVKGTWDEADRLFAMAPTEIEADFEAGAKTDTEGAKTKNELAGQVNFKLKWPSGLTVQGKAVVMKLSSEAGKEGTAGLPFKLEGPSVEVEPKLEFSKKLALPDVPEVKVATLKFTPGLKGVVKPDYTYVGVEMLKKIAPKMMGALGLGGVAGALQWLANNPFMWGAYITIKATMATLEEWDEMREVSRHAKGAVDAYTKGFVSAFGGMALGYTTADTDNAPGWAADGAAAGKLAFDAQIAAVQAHPAFMHENFTYEELAQGLRDLGPKNAQNIYDAVYPEASVRIKQVYYDAWEKNIGTTRQILDILQGLADDDASRGRRQGEAEAMKALMGVGKADSAPILKEKDKARVIPVKRVKSWRYTLSNFTTGLAVPNVAEYFQVLNGIRADLGAHKAHLAAILPEMEKANIAVPDFSVTFWVVGYASRRGGQDFNQELADSRAKSVAGLLRGSLGDDHKYNASGKGAAVPKASSNDAGTDIDDPRPESDPAKLAEIKKQKLEEYRKQFPNIPEAEREKMVEERYGATSNEETMRRVDIFMNWEGYLLP